MTQMRAQPSTLRGAISFDRIALSDVICPSCHAVGLTSFYQVQGIPRHSCLLLPSREKALTYPTGSLDLAFCDACGFITNTSFDASHNDYTTTYEETQGFSPTFGAFADRIAHRLIDRYALHGTTIVEIGCGKGEFLIHLCRIGNCRGIGYDPVFRPDRVDLDNVNIQVHPRYFDERSSIDDADCIVCRHTLEHIAPTLDFLRMIRRAIGNRSDVIVFFEVPDVTRQLAEGAFWDMFYEHCSYFTPGSLARLFRHAGFEILELERAYRDQYLLLTARPSTSTADGNDMFGIEDAIAHTSAAIDDFKSRARPTIDHWHSFLQTCMRAKRRVVLWGSGSKSVGFLTTLGNPRDIDYIVDINPHRAGRFQPGLPQLIVQPDFLAEYRPNCVIAMNPMYLNEIRSDLDAMNLSCELIAV